MDPAPFHEITTLVERLSALEKIRLVEYVMRKLAGEWQQGQPQPKRSLYGLCADLGPAPSAEDIEEARREMLAGFPRDDIA